MSTSTNPYLSPQADEEGDRSRESNLRFMAALVYGMFCGGMLGATAGAISLGVLAILRGIVDGAAWGADRGEIFVRLFTAFVAFGGVVGFGIGTTIGVLTGPTLRFSDAGRRWFVRCATIALWTCVGIGSGLWFGWTISGHGAPPRWVWSGGAGLLFAAAAGGAGWLYSMSLNRKPPPPPKQSEDEPVQESGPLT
jgi:hypothetical protein